MDYSKLYFDKADDYEEKYDGFDFEQEFKNYYKQKYGVKRVPFYFDDIECVISGLDNLDIDDEEKLLDEVKSKMGITDKELEGGYPCIYDDHISMEKAAEYIHTAMETAKPLLKELRKAERDKNKHRPERIASGQIDRSDFSEVKDFVCSRVKSLSEFLSDLTNNEKLKPFLVPLVKHYYTNYYYLIDHPGANHYDWRPGQEKWDPSSNEFLISWLDANYRDEGDEEGIYDIIGGIDNSLSWGDDNYANDIKEFRNELVDMYANKPMKESFAQWYKNMRKVNEWSLENYCVYVKEPDENGIDRRITPPLTYLKAMKVAKRCNIGCGEDLYYVGKVNFDNDEESLNEAEVTEPFDSPDNNRLRHLMKNRSLLRTDKDRKFANKYGIWDLNRVGGLWQGDMGNPITVEFGDDGIYSEKEIPFDKIDKVNVIDMANKQLEMGKNNAWKGPKYYDFDRDLIGFRDDKWGDKYDGRYEEDPVGRYHRDKHQANIDRLEDQRELKAKLDRIDKFKQNRVTKESFQESLRKERLKDDGKPGKYLKNLFKD